MNSTNPAFQNVAQRLIALEAARDGRPVVSGGDAGRVCAKLRVPFARLAGVASFQVLLSRTVTIAQAEVPGLATLQVGPDGSLEGFDGIESARVVEAEIAVVSRLLALLANFIGEHLTMRFVLEAWPYSSVAEPDLGSGDVA